MKNGNTFHLITNSFRNFIIYIGFSSKYVYTLFPKPTTWRIFSDRVFTFLSSRHIINSVSLLEKIWNYVRVIAYTYAWFTEKSQIYKSQTDRDRRLFGTAIHCYRRVPVSGDGTCRCGARDGSPVVVWMRVRPESIHRGTGHRDGTTSDSDLPRCPRRVLYLAIFFSRNYF